eukprot:CAMPEP_0201934400 /NCGR_PEP_ID=MMETSP0903-20130614/33534_1 /ASSEMBLY_ACC=CAM_ASM_000552 /TAXON_ID=420261 /ORGANISM="Thalassiosira antarctica, Strain CCMP982" /LENGTH=312 /DNA_ID=CAMNT_0048474605 /DNA_START=192 /DNA_END=1130 /DNA_ORIENTATION=+
MIALAKHPILALAVYYMTTQISAFHPPNIPQISHGPVPNTKTSLASTAQKSDDSRTAPKVVASKFDSYAATFESHLVGNLKYCAPNDVARAALDRITSTRNNNLYASALDAGCGTGLAGPPLRQLVEGSLIGVDISSKMAELAAELVVDDAVEPVVKDRLRRCAETARVALGSEAPNRLYDGVFTADLLNLDDATFLDGYGCDVEEIPSKSEPFELIVSADVLCYFGAMDEILQAFSGRLAVGGDCIFTTERMKAGDYNWVETSSGRFAQSPGYVERMAAEAGLVKVSQTAFTPRMESGEKVLGTLHVFTKK